ncbi:putative bifunctional diguanylate cyclase/phosphodiesterase [Marinomonas algicola]|uniref:putative bifunctional diguanylate cyclase/phosphodiesterase n=1 Tax=Marinomonas algicola TaxID=2773454 RepID=UPI00174D726B|nr:EAL domain-containing protein [Marinomonas algicola]
MQFAFTRSLFGKQAIATLLLAVILSLIVSALTFYSNVISSREAISQEFNALLAVVEKPAVQAAFRIDEVLAQQQINGLMQNKYVLKAEMLDENGNIFASSSRSVQHSVFYIEMANWLLPKIDQFELVLRYEDRNVILGKIILTADREFLIEEILEQNVLLLIGSLVKDILLASLISLFFYYMVTRPLKKLTVTLSESSRKSIHRLPIITPAGHENDELGELSRVFSRVFQKLTDTHTALEYNIVHTQAIIAHAGDAIFLVEEDGKICLVNKASERLLDRKEDKLLGCYMEEFHTAKGWEYFNDLLVSLALDQPLTLETHYLSDNGIKIPVEIRLIKYNLQHKVEVLLLVRDISARKEAEDRINRLAFYDPLTQLPNRRYLLDRLDSFSRSNKKEKKTGALLFLDLDRFKNINDSLGHNVGDNLLRLVAADLESLNRDEVVTARLGGDEFVVLWPNIEGSEEFVSEKIALFAQEIISVFAMPKNVGLHELHITVSIGITIFNDLENDATILLKQADTALYKAKDAGRNTYRFYSHEMQAMSDERMSMDKSMHEAIEHGEFELYFQPQNAFDGACTGAEVLIRWPRADGSFTPPGVFIPLAEEIGLINSIGDWVMEESFRQLSVWIKEGFWQSDWKLSINVSAIQFQQSDFLLALEMLLTKYSLAPEYIDLEITESMLLGDLTISREKMNKIRELGAFLSIDDFGTGYSSLKYLKTLPINRLKIDQSFVRDLLVDKSDTAIIAAIIAMSKALDIEVIAEGVETEEHYCELQNMGCLRFQGYYFGRPMPAIDFVKSFSKSTVPTHRR